ncbi:MAG: putative lipoprotein [Deltaproteobacteria bacterium]|nr:putative lipoprotein [Deltaproteobacteria bacterium]
MKKQLTWFTSLLGASLLTMGACGGDSGLTGDDTQMPDAAPTPDAPPGVTVVDVPAGDIAVDTHFTADHIYILKGYVFVTGGTLTIDAGTTIKGDNGSALTITKDAKLNAVGTADKPIVFTSSAATPASGDWGGLVMAGKGPINVPGGTNKIEGFADTFGERIVYGSATPDATHDCGKLKYARIEYGGFALSVDNELNGLTLTACGSQTVIDFVQVHLGLDDGIEVFGGTVNLNHVVVTQPDDDGLDWDLGWTGKAQFVIIQQRAGRGDKGIEADSNRSDGDLAPRSAPEIWNATLIGSDGAVGDPQGGMHLRRGTAGKINNAIIAFFPKFAVDIDNAVPGSVAQFDAGALAFKNTYFVKAAAQTAIWPANFDVGGNPPAENDGGLDEAAVLGGDATNHQDVDPQLTDPKGLTAPSWKPAAGSPVLTGCGTPPAGLDQTATFCGAIGTVDWTAGWTRFPG